MKFTIHNNEYDTKDYIQQFVDENTGEVTNRKVLNKSVRLLWFRSVYPKARIVKEIVTAGLPTDIIKSLPTLTDIPEPIWDYVQKLSTRGVACAVAKASVYENTEATLPLSVDYAVRYAEKGFSYNNEAALNAAVDRAIADVGFIAPEELCVDVPTPANIVNDINKSNKAIANLQELLDSGELDNLNSNVAVTEASGEPCYDKSTPVEDIIKMMSKADAKAYLVSCGKHAGKTVGEMYEDTKDKDGYSNTLDFFTTKYRGADNILRAACSIVNSKKQ